MNYDAAWIDAVESAAAGVLGKAYEAGKITIRDSDRLYSRYCEAVEAREIWRCEAERAKADADAAHDDYEHTYDRDEQRAAAAEYKRAKAARLEALKEYYAASEAYRSARAAIAALKDSEEKRNNEQKEQ